MVMRGAESEALELADKSEDFSFVGNGGSKLGAEETMGAFRNEDLFS
jgi:hypothetical protein